MQGERSLVLRHPHHAFDPFPWPHYSQVSIHNLPYYKAARMNVDSPHPHSTYGRLLRLLKSEQKNILSHPHPVLSAACPVKRYVSTRETTKVCLFISKQVTGRAHHSVTCLNDHRHYIHDISVRGKRFLRCAIMGKK